MVAPEHGLSNSSLSGKDFNRKLGKSSGKVSKNVFKGVFVLDGASFGNSFSYAPFCKYVFGVACIQYRVKLQLSLKNNYLCQSILTHQNASASDSDRDGLF